MKNREKEVEIMLEKRDSIYAQLIAGYGIMTALVFISLICSCFVNGNADYENLLIILSNAYAPTTISFLATGLFDFEFIKERKTINSVYITLTVTIALFYAAFSSMDLVGASPSVVFAYLSVASSLIAVCAIVIHTTKAFSNSATAAKRKTSDGTIFGRRMLKP